MKKYYLTFVIFFIAVSFADAQVKEKIDQLFNIARPIMASVCILAIVIGGLLNIGKIREGGESAKSAMLNWGMMVIWPIIIFGAVEILRAFIE